MIEFHDYDPAHPFEVFGEKHIIQGSKITLDYVPLKGSVHIEGFSENTTGTPQRGEFYIEYGAEDNYRTADQIVHFPEGYDGYLVTVDYKGVSTILRAKHMNEIKRFMEYGASELAARMIVLHEKEMQEQMQEWRDSLLAEVRGIKETLAEAFEKGAEGGGCPFCPCRRKDIFPDETMDSGDVEEERQGEPVQYDGGDITDESTDHPSYANDAGEIISEGGKEPTAQASDVSESLAGGEVVENSEAASVIYDGGEIA